MNKAAFYQLVQQIPAGKVTTYGQLARVLQLNPRYVGYLLHHNPDPVVIPCHRVVNHQGRLAAAYAFGGASAHKQRLTQEGIEIVNNRIDLHRYGWSPLA